MALLIGRYEYSLDGKNRVAIPPKFREALKAERGGSLYLTSGLEGCLYIFLPTQWEHLLSNDLAAFALPDKEEERAFKRKFFSEAVELEPDSTGRVLIPSYLKDYAALRGPVLVQGVGRRGEIWDKGRWASYHRRRVEPVYRQASKRLEI